MHGISLTGATARLPALVLSAALVACSGGESSPSPEANGSSPSPTPAAADSAAGRIDALGQATSVEQRAQAIESIARQGLTLGLVDGAGNQLNTNVPADSLSLTPQDVAAHAALVPGSHYRTISYVVDSLAEHGVTLASTGETIDVEQLLREIQAYVDRSFSDPDAEASALGLLIGSGHGLQVPASPPTLTGDTLISPLASSMMAADILLGVDAPTETASADIASRLVSIVLPSVTAAEDETLTAIKGLLTTIKPIMSSIAERLPSEQWREHASNVWASLEAGNRFAVRLFGPEGLGPFEVDADGKAVRAFQGEKRIFLDTVGASVPVVAVVTLVPEASLTPILPASYVLSLVSPGQRLGLPLYPDADAELTGPPTLRQDPEVSVGNGGYRVATEDLVCRAGITATRLAEEPRTALLHAAATFDAALLDELDLKTQLFLAMAEIDIDEIKGLIEKVQPTPWVTAVELRALAGLVCGKDHFSEAAGGGVSFDGCRLEGLPHGSGRYYYEDGALQSDCVYDKGELDGLCTHYYGNPVGVPECEASYVDGELEWENCYRTNGTIWSELDFTGDGGVGSTYHRSGRIASECDYTADRAIECRHFCDAEGGAQCGQSTADEYGDEVVEWDECDTACS